MPVARLKFEAAAASVHDGFGCNVQAADLKFRRSQRRIKAQEKFF
ncbi:MAG TPA: hypothetical protein VJN64_04540 [Terriglobales bacterium]|nr:hypothetical protein [Terriglobales bacterium]